MPQKLGASPNELDTLITLSIKSETPDSGETPQVRLGSMHWPADNANGLGSQMEMLEGQTEMSRAQTDAPNTSNRPETAGMSNGKGAETYLGAGDAKRVMCEMDGLGSHADMSDGHLDIPSIETNALIPIIAPETVSTCPTEVKLPDIPDSTANWTLNESDGPRGHADRSSACTHAYSVAYNVETARDEAETISTCPIESKPPDPPTKGTNGCANKTNGSRSTPRTLNMRTHSITPANEAGTISMRQIGSKWPNSPSEAARQTLHELNAIGDHMDMPTVHTDAHSVEMAMETATDRSKRIRTHQNGEQMQYSPETHEIMTPKHIYRRRKVSAGDNDVYALWNVPVEAPS